MSGRALADRLVLSKRGEGVFSSHPAPTRERGPGRVFGGLLLAQGLLAASEAKSAGPLQALHARFLSPTRYGEPIEFRVSRMRDGVSIDVRRVSLRQASLDVCSVSASFSEEMEAAEFDLAPPAVPGPDGIAAVPEARGELAQHLELRPLPLPPVDGVAWWVRPRVPLPDDARLHAAALVYASDGAPVAAAIGTLRLDRTRLRAASLDHAFWLHGPARFDDWHLLTAHCPVARAGHVLAHGAIHKRDGRRVASFAQGARLYEVPAG